MNNTSNNVKVKNGSLNDAVVPENSILVVEIYGKEERQLPLQEMLDDRENEDLGRKYRMVQSSSVKCISRTASHSDNIYTFIRIDSEAELLDCIKRLRNELEYFRGKTVYMQRISFDHFDCAKSMLEQLGMNAVYYTGEEMNSQKAISTKFKINFTKSELYRFCRSRILGQDAELSKAVYLVSNYIESAARGIDIPANNWMITAPSGMGKTEFYRCIEDFLKEHDIPIPVLRIDLSTYTENGFKGRDATDIPEIIRESQISKRLDPAVAICFFDEADKKMMPSFDSKGININAAIQSDLLTLVEGVNTNGFDSSKTMFIFLGAFQKIRDDKHSEAKLIKDCFPQDDSVADPSEAFYADITLSDMIEQGMLEELGGRLTTVVNFHRIDEKTIRKLIRDKAEQIGSELDCDIRITSSGMNELLEIAYTNLGVRKPMNVIRELVISVLARHIVCCGEDNSHAQIVISGTDKVRLCRHKDTGTHYHSADRKAYESA